jgi:ankyrin repeat protein
VADDLQFFLKEGAKVNVRDLKGSSPLTYAVEYGSEEAVRVLV